MLCPVQSHIHYTKLSTCGLVTQNYNYFFLVILKGTGRKLEEKKKMEIKPQQTPAISLTTSR